MLEHISLQQEKVLTWIGREKNGTFVLLRDLADGWRIHTILAELFSTIKSRGYKLD